MRPLGVEPRTCGLRVVVCSCRRVMPSAGFPCQSRSDVSDCTSCDALCQPISRQKLRQKTGRKLPGSSPVLDRTCCVDVGARLVTREIATIRQCRKHRDHADSNPQTISTAWHHSDAPVSRSPREIDRRGRDVRGRVPPCLLLARLSSPLVTRSSSASRCVANVRTILSLYAGDISRRIGAGVQCPSHRGTADLLALISGGSVIGVASGTGQYVNPALVPPESPCRSRRPLSPGDQERATT